MKKRLLAGLAATVGLIALFSVALDNDDTEHEKADNSASSLTYREVGVAAQNYPDFQGKAISDSNEPPVRQGDWATTVIQVGVDDPQTSSTSRVLLHFEDGAWKMVASDDASKFCDKVPDKIKAAMYCP